MPNVFLDMSLSSEDFFVLNKGKDTVYFQNRDLPIACYNNYCELNTDQAGLELTQITFPCGLSSLKMIDSNV